METIIIEELPNREVGKGHFMTDRINEKLGAWLVQTGHSKTQLAKELDLSRPALRQRFNGDAKWKWEQVVRISELTGCSLNELADYQPEVAR